MRKLSWDEYFIVPIVEKRHRYSLKPVIVIQQVHVVTIDSAAGKFLLNFTFGLVKIKISMFPYFIPLLRGLCSFMSGYGRQLCK